MFKAYGETGMCKRRYYVHSEPEAVEHNKHFGLTDLAPGVFTPWEDIEANSDLLFYEGLHGLAKDETKGIDADRYVDLGIGVVPVVNLEWIQKIRRDTAERGYEPEEVRRTILRRMPDYVNFIVPQYSQTDINFQRVPLVDTSNPLDAREIPTPEESLVVVHFNDRSRVRADFDLMLRELPGSFLSHPQTVVVPGLQQERALELILKPAVAELVARRDAIRSTI